MDKQKITNFLHADQRDDEVFHVEPRPGARIRFGSELEDEELGRRITRGSRLPRMRKSASNTSQMSTNSTRSLGRRYSIDPSTALPITYHTVSFAIEESKEKQLAEASIALVKKDAVAELGELEWHTLTIDEVQQRLSTSLTKGLLKDQVDLKLKEFGKNIPSKPPSDLFSRIFGYLFGGFGSVLLIGGILVTITYKPLGNLNPQIAILHSQ